MFFKYFLFVFHLFLSSCSNWDSNNFEPTASNLANAQRIKILKKENPVDSKNCFKIGEIKILSYSKGQLAHVVAAKKYKTASMIKHTDSRMHGGFWGEGPTDFFDVYECKE